MNRVNVTAGSRATSPSSVIIPHLEAIYHHYRFPLKNVIAPNARHHMAAVAVNHIQRHKWARCRHRWNAIALGQPCQYGGGTFRATCASVTPQIVPRLRIPCDRTRTALRTVYKISIQSYLYVITVKLRWSDWNDSCDILLE